jgi:hypothetical protein
MSGVGLLHGVHRKRADGVDRQLINVWFRCVVSSGCVQWAWKVNDCALGSIIGCPGSLGMPHAANSLSVALLYLARAVNGNHMH